MIEERSSRSLRSHFKSDNDIHNESDEEFLDKITQLNELIGDRNDYLGQLDSVITDLTTTISLIKDMKRQYLNPLRTVNKFVQLDNKEDQLQRQMLMTEIEQTQLNVHKTEELIDEELKKPVNFKMYIPSSRSFRTQVYRDTAACPGCKRKFPAHVGYNETKHSPEYFRHCLFDCLKYRSLGN